MPKGKGKRPNTAIGYKTKQDLKIIEAQGQQQLMQDLVKYVGEDIRSQLLLVALTGTGLSTVLEAYKKFKTNEETVNPGVQVPPIWSWFLVGGLGGMAAYSIASDIFDLPKLGTSGGANNPYSLVGSMLAATKTTSGLAWAALFASLIMGEGGIGGILNKAGGGGFGSSIASVAGL